MAGTLPDYVTASFYNPDEKASRDLNTVDAFKVSEDQAQRFNQAVDRLNALINPKGQSDGLIFRGKLDAGVLRNDYLGVNESSFYAIVETGFMREQNIADIPITPANMDRVIAAYEKAAADIRPLITQLNESVTTTDKGAVQDARAQVELAVRRSLRGSFSAIK